MRICVIGYPSKVGGADTELDHQIRCWQAMDVEVHLLHTGLIDSNLQQMHMEKRGCIIHEPRNWKSCKGMPVISYCNGQFLKSIRQIREYATKIMWVNCMSYLFDLEKDAHKDGLIDFFIYQTDHVMEKVRPELILINKAFHYEKIRPYFHKDDFSYIRNRPTDKFRFGRISRDDAAKFHQAQLWVYEAMVAPTLKEGIILGINDTVRKKIGQEPNWIKGYKAGAISAQELYKHSECVIQMSDTYENLPRIAFEAMSSGSMLIVDNRGGWKELVLHKQTGFLCNNQREFVYYSSRAAFEPEERRQATQNAYDWLNTNWSMESAKKEWSRLFNKIF
jgi:glycosyltransferase involved in cell wall biosynthesis